MTQQIKSQKRKTARKAGKAGTYIWLPKIETKHLPFFIISWASSQKSKRLGIKERGGKKNERLVQTSNTINQRTDPRNMHMDEMLRFTFVIHLLGPRSCERQSGTGRRHDPLARRGKSSEMRMTPWGPGSSRSTTSGSGRTVSGSESMGCCCGTCGGRSCSSGGRGGARRLRRCQQGTHRRRTAGGRPGQLSRRPCEHRPPGLMMVIFGRDWDLGAGLAAAGGAAIYSKSLREWGGEGRGKGRLGKFKCGGKLKLRRRRSRRTMASLSWCSLVVGHRSAFCATRQLLPSDVFKKLTIATLLLPMKLETTGEIFYFNMILVLENALLAEF